VSSCQQLVHVLTSWCLLLNFCPGNCYLIVRSAADPGFFNRGGSGGCSHNLTTFFVPMLRHSGRTVIRETGHCNATPTVVAALQHRHVLTVRSFAISSHQICPEKSCPIAIGAAASPYPLDLPFSMCFFVTNGSKNFRCAALRFKGNLLGVKPPGPRKMCVALIPSNIFVHHLYSDKQKLHQADAQFTSKMMARKR
jgi:hypothetical protein